MAIAKQHAELKLFVGTEAEGRLRGMPTLYVSDDHRLHPADVQYLNVRHVWFNPEYLQAVGFAAIDDFLHAGWMVTVALTPQMLVDARRNSWRFGGQPNLHIVLIVPTPPGFDFLRADDEIRFDFAPLYTAVARRGDFVQSRPADYEGDVAVERKP